MSRRNLIGLTLVLALMTGSAVALAQYGGGNKNQNKTKPKPPAVLSLQGKRAPDFQLATLDGSEVKLSDLKGNVVVLDFWASWCGPCKMSMPHIQELASNTEMTEKGLKVLAVNMTTWRGETPEKAKQYMTSNNFTFPVPLDTKGEVSKSYKLESIPTSMVIGRDGMVKKVFVGYHPEKTPAELDKAIEQALRARAPAAKAPATSPSQG